MSMPEWIADPRLPALWAQIYDRFQWFFLGAILVVLIWARPRTPPSQFKSNANTPTTPPADEATDYSSGSPDIVFGLPLLEPKNPDQARSQAPPKIQKAASFEPKWRGQPHEILGVSPHASSSQIQKAYRQLMKRYHPDRVARAGTPAWHAAQTRAELINQARSELVLRQKPKKA